MPKLKDHFKLQPAVPKIPLRYTAHKNSFEQKNGRRAAFCREFMYDKRLKGYRAIGYELEAEFDDGSGVLRVGA